MGRWLALVGTSLSVAGTAVLMSVNPRVKSVGGALLDRLPEPLRSHKTQTVVGLVVMSAAIAGLVIAKRLKK